MPFETGELIYINYTAKIKETGETIETTRDDEAKKLGIHDPTRKYENRLVSVGEGWVLKGLDEVLQSANVGDKLTVEVPPEKGFGTRDPEKVRMIPVRKFGERGEDLRVGDEVEVEGRIGIVRFAGSGRVQVDFNHRFAGKTIIYDAEVVKKVGDDREKVVALVKRRLPIDEDKIGLEIEGDTVKIQLPSDYYLAEGLQVIKRAVATDIGKFVKAASKVLFIETYETGKPKEVTEKPAEAVAATPSAKAEAAQQESSVG